eukprot:20330-Heterococcus_DN1.PRE.1
MAVVIPIDPTKQQKQLQRKKFAAKAPIAAQSSTEDGNKPRSASTGASTLLRASAFQFKVTGSAPTGIRYLEKHGAGNPRTARAAAARKWDYAHEQHISDSMRLAANLNGTADVVAVSCAIMFRSLSISKLDATLGAVTKDVAAAQLVCKQRDCSNSISNTAAVAPCSDAAITSSTSTAITAVSNAAVVQAPHSSSSASSSNGTKGIKEFIDANSLLRSSACVGPTVALAWGAGAQYRLGNGFDSIKNQPARLHPSLKGKRIVAVACGLRHSIIVTSKGKLYIAMRLVRQIAVLQAYTVQAYTVHADSVRSSGHPYMRQRSLLYSVGEGRAYQLGLTSALQCGVRDAVSGTIAPVKAAAYAAQRVPKQVLPSGALRFDRGVHCVQAAAGDTCSYARECNGADACAAIEGYQWMVDSVTALLNSSAPVSPHLLHLLQWRTEANCYARSSAIYHDAKQFT